MKRISEIIGMPQPHGEISFLTSGGCPAKLLNALRDYAGAIGCSEASAFDVAAIKTIIELSDFRFRASRRALDRLRELERDMRPARDLEPGLYGLNLAAQAVQLWKLRDGSEAERKGIAAYFYLSRAEDPSPADLLQVMRILGDICLKNKTIDLVNFDWIKTRGNRYYRQYLLDGAGSALLLDPWYRTLQAFEKKLSGAKDKRKDEGEGKSIESTRLTTRAR